MPIFFQHQVNEHTRLGVWKIEETDAYFKGNVPVHREVTHPHKRVQHLAGRFLLQFLRPAFPYELIQIADTRKPFLPEESMHFSISHCGDYAAAIVSDQQRVGIDVEVADEKIVKMANKFASAEEQAMFRSQWEEDDMMQWLTVIWSAKEAVFKWYSLGGVDFKEHIHLTDLNIGESTIGCHFTKTDVRLEIHYRKFNNLVLAWVSGSTAF